MESRIVGQYFGRFGDAIVTECYQPDGDVFYWNVHCKKIGSGDWETVIFGGYFLDNVEKSVEEKNTAIETAKRFTICGYIDQKDPYKPGFLPFDDFVNRA